MRHYWRLAFTALSSLIAAGALVACTAGYAPAPSNGPSPLDFVYPGNGAQGVANHSQIVLNFPGNISASTAQSALTLVDAAGNAVPFKAAAPGGGVVLLQSADGSATPLNLQPNTTYTLKTTKPLSFGRDHFVSGAVLTSFTTQRTPGAPDPNGFVVVSHSPGNSPNKPPFSYGVFTYTDKNGDTVNIANTVHIRFSESLDPATVVLGKSFSFTDAKGTAIPGRLYVQGNQLSFQPTGVLTPGVTYTVSMDKTIQSVDGSALTPSSFSLQAEAACNAAPAGGNSSPPSKGYCRREFLAILQTGNTLPAPGTPPDPSVKNPLNGKTTNSITLSSPVIGTNTAYAQDDPSRHRVTTYLGTPCGVACKPGAPFYSVVPAVLPAGTQLGGTSLSVKLGGKVPANLDTGNLKITALDAANVYLGQNAHRTDGQPTAALLHLDLAIAAGKKLSDGSPNKTYAQANGVLNQTVLNVQATGTAVVKTFPDGQSALVINTVGSFPLKLANTGVAVANLTLRLVLPVNDTTLPDTTPPALTAQSPSACLYNFGSTGHASKTGAGSESDCGGASAINGFPVTGNPSLTFSEPLDPTTFAKGLQFTGGGVSVAFTAREAGTTIVLHPDQPLTPATTYTITAGTDLTDLSGNALASPQTVSFTTEPYVTSPAAAPFITALVPGLPCALDTGSGNFTTGGDTAGYCLGDAPVAPAKHQVFPVFAQPVNRPVGAFFTKPVKTSSIVPADGCLTSGTPANTVSSASFAVEAIDASGNCTGVVAGGVVIPHAGSQQTRYFEYIPQQPLPLNQRYWLVICGNSGSVCSASIKGIDGNALNTDPLKGSGSGSSSDAGGPDIIMPFQTQPGPAPGVPFNAQGQDDNYAIVLQAQPFTDTNGNGNVDGAEKTQTATQSVVNILGAPFSSFIAGDRPIELLPPTTDCSAVPAGFTDGTPKVCLPVLLSSGGMFNLTSINIGLQSLIGNVAPNLLAGILGVVPPLNATVDQVLGLVGSSLSAIPPLAKTGRVILRLQGSVDAQGKTQPFQKIYIVPSCTKGIPGGLPASPCTIAKLNLSVNAPDGSGASVAQQTLTATLVGPLSFQQNGRMFIDLQNTGTLTITAKALGLLPLPATIKPGGIHLQLDGYPVHGQ